MHLHIGSQITAVYLYVKALRVALDLIDDVERELGVTLPVGSTWAAASPSPYRERPLGARRRLLLFTGPRRGGLRRCGLRGGRACGARSLELCLEPGRSIAADTAILVTRVESDKMKRLRDQPRPSGR